MGSCYVVSTDGPALLWQQPQVLQSLPCAGSLNETAPCSPDPQLHPWRSASSEPELEACNLGFAGLIPPSIVAGLNTLTHRPSLLSPIERNRLFAKRHFCLQPELGDLGLEPGTWSRVLCRNFTIHTLLVPWSVQAKEEGRQELLCKTKNRLEYEC